MANLTHAAGPGVPEPDGPHPARGPTPANRLGLDYRAEAARLGRPVVPIIDVHTHVNGAHAAGIYREACDLYGVDHTYSQTQLSQAAAVRRVMGSRVRFIAIPEYMAKDRRHALTDGFVENLRIWHGEHGARCVKLWNAPRLLDLSREAGIGDADVLRLDNAMRRRVADAAVGMGMMFMTHIADPDTWFATKYADAARYMSKQAHYEGLERMLEAYRVPWIAAHMGGWPEDLAFLDGLLSRHPNLHLDTSATKWMVRELSRHPHEAFRAFMLRWWGRLFFGSDIVTLDEHLTPVKEDAKRFGAELAGSEAEAFDLYASRYWALRTMWETAYDGESPIADPDLAMVDPTRFGPMDAPRLVGRSMPADWLREFYRDAIERVVGGWYARTGGG